jgi:hypothetical protein
MAMPTATVAWNINWTKPHPARLTMSDCIKTNAGFAPDDWT